MPSLSQQDFDTLVERERAAASGKTLCIPISLRLLADQLTPVLAYRRLVAPDERTAPSFLLESVEGGERQGRHSILGAQPAIEVVVLPPGVVVVVLSARHSQSSVQIAGGVQSRSASYSSPVGGSTTSLRQQ